VLFISRSNIYGFFGLIVYTRSFANNSIANFPALRGGDKAAFNRLVCWAFIVLFYVLHLLRHVTLVYFYYRSVVKYFCTSLKIRIWIEIIYIISLLRAKLYVSTDLAPFYFTPFWFFQRCVLTLFRISRFVWPEHHWRDKVCRNANLVHQNWYMYLGILYLYSLIRRTGPHVPQQDPNPRRKDRQILTPCLWLLSHIHE
jgi:hypothetical protein